MDIPMTSDVLLEHHEYTPVDSPTAVFDKLTNTLGLENVKMCMWMSVEKPLCSIIYFLTGSVLYYDNISSPRTVLMHLDVKMYEQNELELPVYTTCSGVGAFNDNHEYMLIGNWDPKWHCADVSCKTVKGRQELKQIQNVLALCAPLSMAGEVPTSVKLSSDAMKWYHNYKRHQ